jgi:mannose-6-phosphate isomerase-like protein (cupin superfamily)
MAVQRAPGISRTDLQEHDLSIPGYEVIQNRVDIGPEAPFVRHKHPRRRDHLRPRRLSGVHHRWPDPKTYSAGEALMIPADTVHAVRNVGNGNASELATYVVEKGKPFLVVVE